MKKKLLILGAAFLTGLATVIYSCALDNDTRVTGQTVLSPRVLEAKAFFEKNY
jgi:hypothetical protein